MTDKRIVLTVQGPDKLGLVAKYASFIHNFGGNIINADNHLDQERGVFLTRLEWNLPTGKSQEDASRAFLPIAEDSEARFHIQDMKRKPIVAIFVSKQDHCLYDLIIKQRHDEIFADIAFIAGNHESLKPIAEDFGIPWYTIPISKDTKAEAEARQIELLREHKVELLILAKYMQILSPKFINQNLPTINIHHSFLPAFPGAKPYHQAHSRGVKVIGATAHYVTAELDAGPIIEQDVCHVSHRHTVEDFIREGKDIEKRVLSNAVRMHLENRILVYENRTVVFD